jgi:hypothetical protein
MAGKIKTYKDYSTVFQINKIDKDKFVLLGVFTKKQLETLMHGLHEEYEERASGWRGQYQALAKAIVQAYENLEEK